MNEALTQREFDGWREQDDEFKKDMRGFISTQTAVNLNVHGRVTSLETARQQDAIKLGIFSTVVSGVGAVLAALWRLK